MAFNPGVPIDFALEITTPITFRNAIEVMGHTLALATFFVEREPTSKRIRLKVDSMDVSKVCAIKLRVMFHGSVSDEAFADARPSPSFTLKLRMLLVLLKTMATTDTLHIYRVTGEDSLRLRSVGSDVQEYELKTLAETFPPVAINDIVGAAFSIEFDISRLKMMTKVANSVRADHLRFRVALADTNEALTLVVSCDGDDAQGLWEFRSHKPNNSIDNDDGPPTKRRQVIARTTSAAATAATEAFTYDATFPVTYISSFVKAMDRSTVVITLCTGHPLVVEYPLGLEHSNIRFLLAPRVS